MARSYVTVHKQEKGKLVHIEAPGCIVNIRVGLADEKGREITSVEVLADGDRFAGASWRIVDENQVPEKGRARAIRIRKDR